MLLSKRILCNKNCYYIYTKFTEIQLTNILSMKKLIFLLTGVLLVFTIVSCEKDMISEDNGNNYLKSTTSTSIVTVAQWNPAGGADAECIAAGGSCGNAYKIDGWDATLGMDGTYNSVITIADSDGETFDWTSTVPVCRVIVKAGRGAIIYNYEGGAYHDEGLVGYQDKDISHVTFCYGEDQQVIAIKSQFWYEDGSYSWAVSSGTNLFSPSEGWCDILGVNYYPGVTSFTIGLGWKILGSVNIVEGINSLTVTVDLNDGLTLDNTYLYFGSLSGLLSNVESGGCPNYLSWPYQDDSNQNTHVFTIPY